MLKFIFLKYFSVISVSAGHQFAVNRWNPGYSGGKTGGGAGGQVVPPANQGGPKVPGSEPSPGPGGQVVGSGGIFCFVFIFICTTNTQVWHSSHVIINS